MNYPLVSVVIPCFNAAETIDNTIASVLKQNWPALQVIAVDDASKDNTCEVVKAISDPRVVLVELEKNGGGSVARNAGIDRADGVYVAFLDADDHWSENKIQEQIETLEQAGFPEKAVVYNAINMVMDDGIITRPDYPWDRSIPIDEYMITRRQIMQTSGLMLKTSFAKEVRFDDNLRKYQDTDFILSLRQEGADFIFCSAPTVFFDSRSKPSRVSLSKDPRKTEQFLNKWDNILTDKTKAFYNLCAIAPMTMGRNPLKSFGIYFKWAKYSPPIMKDVIEAAILWIFPLSVYDASRSIFHKLKKSGR
jgi:glycosyltransferase involved in cell wall biosynthesis